MARPCSRAHRSSASALMPFMSDLKPPSQSNPGVAPSRARTAIGRAVLSIPTCRIFRQRSLIWVFGYSLAVHAESGVRESAHVSPHADAECKRALQGTVPGAGRGNGIGEQ